MSVIVTTRYGWASTLHADPDRPGDLVLRPGNMFNLAWGCGPIGIDCRGCVLEEIFRKQGVGYLWASGQVRAADENRWSMLNAWQRSAALAGQRMHIVVSETCDPGDDHPVIVGQLDRLWATIEASPDVDWIVLTKRPEALRHRIPETWASGWPRQAILAVSAGVPRLAALRIAAAQQVPGLHTLAIVLEPLLAPVDLANLPRPRRDEIDDLLVLAHPDPDIRRGHVGFLSDALAAMKPLERPLRWWVIAGGEYGIGHRARWCDPDWLRLVAQTADDAGVPVFVRGLGSVQARQHGLWRDVTGQDWAQWPTSLGDLRRRAWPDGTVWPPDAVVRPQRWPNDLTMAYDDQARARRRQQNAWRRSRRRRRFWIRRRF